MCTSMCEDHETDRCGPKYIKSHLFKLWHKPYTKGPQGAGWPNLMQVPAVTRGPWGWSGTLPPVWSSLLQGSAWEREPGAAMKQSQKGSIALPWRLCALGRHR